MWRRDVSADCLYPSIHPTKDFPWNEQSDKAEDLLHTHSGNLVAWKSGKSSQKSPQAFQNRARINTTIYSTVVQHGRATKEDRAFGF